MSASRRSVHSRAFLAAFCRSFIVPTPATHERRRLRPSSRYGCPGWQREPGLGRHVPEPSSNDPKPLPLCGRVAARQDFLPLVPLLAVEAGEELVLLLLLVGAEVECVEVGEAELLCRCHVMTVNHVARSVNYVSE